MDLFSGIKQCRYIKVCMSLESCSVSKSPSFWEGELWMVPHVGRAGVKKGAHLLHWITWDSYSRLLGQAPHLHQVVEPINTGFTWQSPWEVLKKMSRRGRSFHRTNENPATTCSEWILRWPRESHCRSDLRWFWGLTENFVRVQVAWQLC